MARRIKSYNYSYRVALRFLKEHPKTELAVVYMWTIANLDSKHNFSKEGVRRAWNDFKKPKVFEANWTSPIFNNKSMGKLYEKGLGYTGIKIAGAKPQSIIVDESPDQLNQNIFDKMTKRLLDEKKVEDHIHDAMIYGTSFMKTKL